MLSRRPSPAAVIALLALFVALGGTGYAAVKINGKDLKNASVTGSKLKKNTLTGKQINESKLGAVPKARFATTANTATTAATATSATTATRALSADTTPVAGNATTVGDQTIERFSLTVTSDGALANRTFGNVGFLAACPSGNGELILNNAASQGAALDAGWVNNAGGTDSGHQLPDETFDSSDADDIANHGSGAGTAVVAFADGSVTTIDYGFMDNAQNTGHGCRFYGRVISG